MSTDIKPDLHASSRTAPFMRPLWPATGATVLVAVFLTTGVVGSVISEGFFSVDNARTIMISSAFVGVIAVGMTVIMLSGNVFSLSSATTAAITAGVFLSALRWGWPIALLLAVALGGCIGWVQGVVIGAVNANPIIVTLAASVLQTGAYLGLTGGVTVLPSAPPSSFSFLNSRPLGIPIAFLVFVATALIVEVLLRRTTFGRGVYAIGENRSAGRAAGLRVFRITAGAFLVAGMSAGLAGVLMGAFNANATLSIAGTYNFDAIAAALVGGSLVTGGTGSVLQTFFGAILIAMITSVVLLAGYSTGVQLLVKGLVVLVVVCVVQVSQRRVSR